MFVACSPSAAASSCSDEPFTGVDVKTEEAIVGLLRELRAEGRLILVSTHNLGSVPEFCDQVVLINRTVLACGPTSEVFTAENLTLAFGGALRHFDLAQSTVHDHDGRQVTVLTDDDVVALGRHGHLEYLDRTGREKLISERETEPKTETSRRAMTLHDWLTPFQYDEHAHRHVDQRPHRGVCGLLSGFITLKGWSLMGDALSHAVVPGRPRLLLAGLPFAVGAFTSGILAAGAMAFVKMKTPVREDAVIGIVFTAFFALGLCRSHFSRAGWT